MRASLYGRTSNSSSSGSSSGGKKNHVEETVCKIVDYENKIDKEIDELVATKLNIVNAINSTPLPEREVLERRYLLFQKWEEIAVAMNFSIRRVHQLHGSALKKIALYFTTET